MARRERLRLKERIEENVSIWLLGTLLTGFGSGVAAYQAVLGMANLTVIDRDTKDNLSRTAADRPALQQKIEELQTTLHQRDVELQGASASIRAMQLTTGGLQEAVTSREKELDRLRATHSSTSVKLKQSDAARARLAATAKRRAGVDAELDKLDQLIRQGEDVVQDQERRLGSEPTLALNREFHDRFEWEWNIKVKAVLERIDTLTDNAFSQEFEHTGVFDLSGRKNQPPSPTYRTTQLRLGVLRSIKFRLE